MVVRFLTGLTSGGMPEWTIGPHSKCGVPIFGTGGSNPPPTVMIKFFKKKKKEPENLNELLAYVKQMENKIGEISDNLDFVRKMAEASIQKIGIVRYNPFKDMGGDQSFVVALLDANDNGFVISSLYLKEGNRVYTKPIKNGESEYPLSEEEKQAVLKAIKH